MDKIVSIKTADGSSRVCVGQNIVNDNADERYVVESIEYVPFSETGFTAFNKNGEGLMSFLNCPVIIRYELPEQEEEGA